MKKVALIFIILLVFLSCFVLFFLRFTDKAVSDNKQTRDFVIAPSEKLVNIAQRLEANKFIRNKYTFIFYTITSDSKNKIKSGKFRLAGNISTQDIIKKLVKGGSADYWLKIIEGQRVEEITPKYPKTEEGYLFPDSYLIPEYYTPAEILTVIKDNFNKKFTQAKQGSNTKLSDKEVLILASLLEREGKALEDKKVIAGILLNRLEIDMGLQVDAAIQYARDSLNKPQKYWAKLTKADMSIDSPYNTYKYRGLPPAPICNPGYDSIYAVFHPTESDYMYYITGKDGQMYYAKSYAEHNTNIAKYLK
jgi:UPF0755 protein